MLQPVIVILVFAVHSTSGRFLDRDPTSSTNTVSCCLFSRTTPILKMGDVLVENLVNSVLPHKKQPLADSIPNIDSLEGSGNDGGDEYSTLKRYQRHLECGLRQAHLVVVC
jgi:hypothetical protein